MIPLHKQVHLITNPVGRSTFEINEWIKINLLNAKANYFLNIIPLIKALGTV